MGQWGTVLFAALLAGAVVRYKPEGDGRSDIGSVLMCPSTLGMVI